MDAMLATLNAAVPFAAHAKVAVTAVSAEGAEAAIPDAPELRNHVGSQHAGALFTLAEAASGAAMSGAFAADLATATPLVRDASIRYLKVARGPISAAARLGTPAAELRATLAETGRAEFPVEVALTDAEGVTIAEASYRWVLRRRG
jgi:acyl-coenzyme A thioesterase PaaI-like protein